MFSELRKHGGSLRTQIQTITYLVSSLSGFSEVAEFEQAHRRWVDDSLPRERMARDARWSEAIAVGNFSFVEKLKSELGFKAAHPATTRRFNSSHRAEAGGAILGIKQRHVSLLMRNRSGNFSVERLMEFLAALGQDVEITVRPSRKHHGQFRFFYLKQQPNRCGEVLIEITNKDFPPGRFHIFGIPKTWKLVRIETFIDHFTGRAFLLVLPASTALRQAPRSD